MGKNVESLAGLGDLLLVSAPSLCEKLICALRSLSEDIYSVFTFGHLHNLHIVISKLLKICV